MSVFDHNNKKDFMKSRMFLDSSPVIQRYDQQKYPFLEKLTDKQLGFFWRPEEVSLTKDSKDFRDLSEHEQHIFLSNLKRQILLDSVQGRAPVAAFGPLCSLPELENWILTWTFSESIHSRSYTHIIRNIFANPSKVFDEILDISQIIDCAKDISKNYDDLIKLSSYYNLLGAGTHTVNGETIVVDEYELKKLLWLCLMSVNILEGVRFYVSFACSWAFAELKKMEGNAKIIKLICFKDTTEILTPSGWKLFSDLASNDLVAQYTTSGDIEFVSPINYIKEKHVGKMYNFTSNSKNNKKFDYTVTGDHRIIFKENDIIKESLAKNFNPYNTKSYIVSGNYDNKNASKHELTSEDIFRIAVQADGHISNRYDGSISGHIPVFFTLCKERKKERLINIVEDLGFKYSITKKGYTVFVPLQYKISKSFDWVDISEVSSNWINEFLSELIMWDGYYNDTRNNTLQYDTTDKECADKVQALATLVNKRTYMSIKEDNRKPQYKTVYRLTITDSTTVNCLNKSSKKEIDYDGYVYCVTVPSGMIVVRDNNKVIISGNCRDENLHLASTQQLLKSLPNDDPDFIKIKEETKQECVNMFISAVDQEKAWAEYLFKDGSMIGLNQRLLSDYIEWIATKRLQAVGLETPYKTGSNPLPWTMKWVAGSEVQIAPQQTQISSYVVGGVTQDVDENSFKGFSL